MSTNSSGRLQSILDIISPLLLEIDESDLYPGVDQEIWSSKEILGHLVDSAIINYRRIIQCLTVDTLVFEGYNQDEYVRIQDYNSSTWLEIVNLWYPLNKQIVRALDNISNESFVKEYKDHNLHEIGFKKFDPLSPGTLRMMCEDYIDHLVHHFNQICDHQKINPDEVENINE